MQFNKSPSFLQVLGTSGFLVFLSADLKAPLFYEDSAEREQSIIHENKALQYSAWSKP